MSWSLRCGLVLFLLVLVVPATAAEEPEVSHTRESLEAIKKALAEKKGRMVDVREREEWDRGHLREALLVPLSALKASASTAAKPLKKDAPVYLHCRSGKRCLEAAKMLKKLGYDARPLSAGYDELVAAGFAKAP